MTSDTASTPGASTGTPERPGASTPGRICLFGEHLDYLGLPVMAAAISLRIQVSAQRSDAGPRKAGPRKAAPRMAGQLGEPFVERSGTGEAQGATERSDAADERSESSQQLGEPERSEVGDERSGEAARQAVTFRLALPDIASHVTIPFAGQPLPYPQARDYFRSAINVLLREGFTFSSDISGTVRGNIPINSGTSSSSALIVTWLNVLTQLADNPRPLSPERLAELAYAAEVLEFGEPGGMMDHYSTAVGGVIYLASQPTITLRSLPAEPLGTFVLGDSGEPKDTIGILRRVKHGMLAVLERLNSVNPAFLLSDLPITAAPEFKDLLSKDEYVLLLGTLRNRDLLRDALTLFERSGASPGDAFDHQRFGRLLTEHHAVLRDAQRISTPKIDRMLDAAGAAGALGGKINGSGGGGCMFAYAPRHADRVAEAIERAGGRAYVVTVGAGTRAEPATT